ncbi:MAG: carboxypeptidase regulatory-like domain-containing protein [Bacillota bacterium]
MRAIVFTLVTMALLAGCDRQPERRAVPKTSGAAGSASTQPIRGQGSIIGQVNLVGWKGPATLPVLMRVPFQDRQIDVPDESVITNSNGTLRNVLLYVKDAPPLDPATDAPPVVLDQVECVYTPHVVAVQVGQPLRVKSSDNTMHNVHLMTRTNQPVNFGMVQPGTKDLSFKAPEIVRAKCDVHPWMLAYVAIFDHPFFAVTREQGTFEIKGLAPGTYTLVAWHERFGELEQTISVGENEPSRVSFTYGPPPQ